MSTPTRPAGFRAALRATTGLRARGRRVVDLVAVALAFAVVIALSLPASRTPPSADAQPVLAQRAP